MNNEEIRDWLDKEWRHALDSPREDPDPGVDRLVDSNVVSIRYAVITQLLGKVADPSRSLLFLQSGGGEPGAWNARSFCQGVVVPWVANNYDVLGTSPEPYVSKPLRRPRLEQDMSDVKDVDEWNHLVSFLQTLDHADPKRVQAAFRRCLAAAVRRLHKQDFRYPIPARITLFDLEAKIKEFLSAQSGGLRSLSVAAALMQIVGDGFSLFSRVTVQGINEADRASGAPGDIMCYSGDGNGKAERLVLAVEVKDRELTLLDVQSSVRKAREFGGKLESLLFAAPRVREKDHDSIRRQFSDASASGLDLNRIDLMHCIDVVFSLLGERFRTDFLRRIGRRLDEAGDQRHRRAWYGLLS